MQIFCLLLNAGVLFICHLVMNQVAREYYALKIWCVRNKYKLDATPSMVRDEDEQSATV